MSGRVVWNENWLPPEAIEAGLKRSAIVAQSQMKRNFGSEGGGVLRKATKKRRKDGTYKKTVKRLAGPVRPGEKPLLIGTGRNVYYPSPPGAFPGVRTGFLRRAVVYWFPRSSEGKKAPFVRIGVPAGLSNKTGNEIADYAAALEDADMNWPEMRRPFAMRTVKQVKRPMTTAFARGMRQYLAGRSG